ncbi:methyltransferase activity, variant 2 [Homalodisca vitripennis]|nr:methyltransferase activity, variant 2 [Homalodisca vitripennis]
MNDKHTIKQKIWEKIAIDIESRGYKIANNRRDAGLRTFQKWRNMERTYWKYLKNPCIFGEDKRRKKPSFFDGVHSVISKRNCYRKEEPPSKYFVNYCDTFHILLSSMILDKGDFFVSHVDMY